MKKRSTGVFIVIMALLFSLSLSGCGSSGGQDSASGDQPNDTKQQQKAGSDAGDSDTGSAGQEEPITINFAFYTTGAFDEKDTVAEKTIEEKFPGVDAVFWPVERDTWTQQLATRIAGGDVPDYFQIFDRDSLVQQGILAEIPIEDIQTYMPGYYQGILEYGPDVLLATYYEGKNYGLPLLSYTNIYPFTAAYRQDWLTNVGIDKVPETLEEMEAAFRAFTFDDPDGNGKDDTIGYSPVGMGSAIFNVFSEIYAAYGVYPDKWMATEDGTFRPGVVTPKGKEVLSILQRWYQEGLIDKEFITIDATTSNQKWANGVSGYMHHTWYRWIPGGELSESLKAVNPDASFVLAPAPKGPNGDYGYDTWDRIGNSYGISAEAKEDTDKYHKLLQIVETIGFQDLELYQTLKFGIKGEHWNPDPETQVPTFVEPYHLVENRGPLGTNELLLIKPCSTEFLWSEYGNLTDTFMIYNGKTSIVAGKDFVEWPGKLMDPDVTQMYQEDANAALSKLIINIITGTSSVDDFDALVADWENAGGAELIREFNRVYKENQDLVQEMLSLK